MRSAARTQTCALISKRQGLCPVGSVGRSDGRGKAFDSSVEFLLPDGSALSPDASWVSNESLSRLSWEQRREFLRLCPEFVIEVMSPSDRLKAAKEEMELWIANGAQLGWLIDGDHETVYVYRKGRPLRTHKRVQELAGEGPVRGLILKLGSIWRGLRQVSPPPPTPSPRRLLRAAPAFGPRARSSSGRNSWPRPSAALRAGCRARSDTQAVCGRARIRS